MFWLQNIKSICYPIRGNNTNICLFDRFRQILFGNLSVYFIISTFPRVLLGETHKFVFHGIKLFFVFYKSLLDLAGLTQAKYYFYYQQSTRMQTVNKWGFYKTKGGKEACDKMNIECFQLWQKQRHVNPDSPGHRTHCLFLSVYFKCGTRDFNSVVGAACVAQGLKP